MTDPRDIRREAWLDRGFTRLTEAFDEVLDIDAGLRDARLPDHRRALERELDVALDVDAGLNAILPGGDSPPVHMPVGAARVDDQPPTMAPLDRLAWQVASRPFHKRLAFRTGVPLEEIHRVRVIADVFSEAVELVFGLGRELRTIQDNKIPRSFDADYDRAFALSLVLDLAKVEGARSTARAVTDAIARARELVTGHGFPGHGAVIWARNLALDLAAKLVEALTDELKRTFRRVREHELGLAVSEELILFRDLPDIREITLHPDRAGREAFQSPRHLAAGITRLDAAVSDFTDADLTDVGLRGVSLQGVRWSSSTTLWPPDWEDAIRHASVQIDPDNRPDLYEIRHDPRIRNTVI